ncbi:MAG: hypothetical protein BJ554DRAFT_7330 [Olpidium bornovanus]|uniref:Uncharacterized protein n=1 Tax=Olpidium bornovanus TaxID=278681 RepID=A0A8H8A1Z9_9FUNG|nr:MAG: hypothetical protein BJ554DRAFT_7330 [Olpidium bornovanus]
METVTTDANSVSSGLSSRDARRPVVSGAPGERFPIIESLRRVAFLTGTETRLPWRRKLRRFGNHAIRYRGYSGQLSGRRRAFRRGDKAANRVRGCTTGPWRRNFGASASILTFRNVLG